MAGVHRKTGGSRIGRGQIGLKLFSDFHDTPLSPIMPDCPIEEIRSLWLPLPAKTGKGGATESSINFQAFERYIGLPVGERSLRRVAQDLNKNEKLIERWSSKFEWIKRVRAWDQHQAMIKAEAREKAAREKAELWEIRREENRESQHQLLKAVTKKAEQATASPLIERITDKAGNIVIRPAKSAISAVPALVQATINLSRAVFPDGNGAPNNIQEIDEFEMVSLPAQTEQSDL